MTEKKQKVVWQVDERFAIDIKTTCYVKIGCIRDDERRKNLANVSHYVAK
jgi:hypothetical protein